MLLFEGFADPEQSRAKVIEAGSWRGGAWRVVESEYAVDALERFGSYRFVTGDVPRPKTAGPMSRRATCPAKK
jgi:hypothetical protein